MILKHTSLAPITETLNTEPVYSVEHPSRSLILISEDSPGVLCPSRPYREANQQDTHQDSESSHNISEIPTVPSTDHPTTPTNNKPNHIPAAPSPAPKKL